MPINPLIVCFATPGPYAQEAERLFLSIQALKLTGKLYSLDTNGWVESVREKPHKLIEIRDRNPGRDILYTDADSYIHEDPWPYLDKLRPCDAAVHRLPDNTVLSGTIYLPAHGAQTDALLDAWAQADDKHPDLSSPQRVLQRVIDGGDFTIGILEPRLCWIFDRSKEIYGPQKPIIEHLQASRQYRHPGGTGTGALLAARMIRCQELDGALHDD